MSTALTRTLRRGQGGAAMSPPPNIKAPGCGPSATAGDNRLRDNSNTPPTAAQDPSKLDAALAYAAAGFHVGVLHYPCDGKCSCGQACGKNAGKHPMTRVMGGGLPEFTTDVATITRWLEQEPNANVGIEAPEGYAFFDVDNPGAMQADGRVWPATLQQHTGRGLHLLYRTNSRKVVN